jgi:hypothetical protein
MTQLPKLPIGIQTFKKLREEDYLYVDKTKYLIDLIDRGAAYFLSRPRRFGKSLTISTLDALFSGEKELFRGLHAEEFFERAKYRIHPVVQLDMSDLTVDMGIDVLRASILDHVRGSAERLGVSVENETPGDAFANLMKRAAKKWDAPAVVLIDEYDSPMLKFISQPQRAQEIRAVLHDFYIRIKAADKYLRFVFVTGISKFSKMGVFSAMNSLKDISMKDEYATMLGYTEEELLSNFDAYIEKTAAKLKESKDKMIGRIRDYYDGFSFDGEHRLYNPFSTLNFFDDAAFKNYWFDSGTPSALAEYVKLHDLEVENFRGFKTDEEFTSVAEIEKATPESFLFQSGYLSVREKNEKGLILDYPNMEVLSSVAKLFFYGKFNLPSSAGAFIGVENALSLGDAETVVKIYNSLLASLPYDLYAREESKYAEAPKEEYASPAYAESFYHSMLFALLWSSRVRTTAENHSYRGRSDIEAEKNGRHYVAELKVADGQDAAEKAADAAMRQIREKGYADKYSMTGAILITLAVDKGRRCVAAYRIETLEGKGK